MRHVPATLLLAASLVAALPFAAPAAAADRVRPERFTVVADVIDVRPVYREVRYSAPRRECWTEEVRTVVREGYSGHKSGGYGGRGRDAGGSQRRGGGDAIVGGVIGGVVGNQLGRHSSGGGRAGATIAGAIVGSVIANEASDGYARHRRNEDRRDRRIERRAPRTVYETRPVERCRTVDTAREERRLQHYDVTYRYEGRTFTTRLPRDPGPRLELNLEMTPIRR